MIINSVACVKKNRKSVGKPAHDRERVMRQYGLKSPTRNNGQHVGHQPAYQVATIVSMCTVIVFTHGHEHCLSPIPWFDLKEFYILSHTYSSKLSFSLSTGTETFTIQYLLLDKRELKNLFLVQTFYCNWTVLKVIWIWPSLSNLFVLCTFLLWRRKKRAK